MPTGITSLLQIHTNTRFIEANQVYKYRCMVFLRGQMLKMHIKQVFHLDLTNKQEDTYNIDQIG